MLEWRHERRMAISRPKFMSSSCSCSTLTATEVMPLSTARYTCMGHDHAWMDRRVYNSKLCAL